MPDITRIAMLISTGFCEVLLCPLLNVPSCQSKGRFNNLPVVKLPEFLIDQNLRNDDLEYLEVIRFEYHETMSQICFHKTATVSFGKLREVYISPVRFVHTVKNAEHQCRFVLKVVIDSAIRNACIESFIYLPLMNVASYE
jgi:hypothetical protein